MSNLVAVIFDDETTAFDARAALGQNAERVSH
jgi:hypothetical protein